MQSIATVSDQSAGMPVRRSHPSLSELKDRVELSTNLMGFAAMLLNQSINIVKDFELFQKDTDEPAQPYIFRAELVNHRHLEPDEQRYLRASGKGMTPVEAQMGALGEGVESYSALSWSYDEMVYARRSELDGASLDPAQLGLYLPEQYAGLPYAPYTEPTTLGWVPARSLVTNQEIFVPAQAVFLAYKPQQTEPLLGPPSSNGLATGPTLPDAVLRSVCEVIERDAFMITWLNRLPCQRVDPTLHPDANIVGLCHAYRRRQVEIMLYRLPTDQPCHVFMALALQQGEATAGPAVAVGLGADMDAPRAARQAILEAAQSRAGLLPYWRKLDVRRYVEALVDRPYLIAAGHDHALRYTSPAALTAFDFLLACSPSMFDWEAQTTERLAAPAQAGAALKLETLVRSLAAQQRDLIYFNLTPPDMTQLRLFSTRAIMPGFQPIHFGYQERRLAIDRLYQLPYQLGLTPSPTTPSQLNPDPHPLA
ncbi:MAG TPA: YcaO-like family protein [Anaerolineae bacterium]|nr:YcaO-like family protein [Anaerolineae bacterium]